MSGRPFAFLLLSGLLPAAPGGALAGVTSAVANLASVPPARQVKCPRSGADADGEPTPTLPQALASLEAVLREGASPEAIRALDQSPEARDPRRASVAAVGALADRRPLAALGLLLRAQRAAPQEPSTLVNLAAIANKRGMYPEALALVGAAQGTGRALAAAGGVQGRALLLNAQGQALVGTGKAREAQRVLEEAIRLQPDLAEAYVNLAYALGDQGKCEQAVRHLRAGAFAQPMLDAVLPPGGETPPGGTVPGEAGDEQTRLPARLSIDSSRGSSGELPEVRLPGGPEGSTEATRLLLAQAGTARTAAMALVPKMASADETRRRRRVAWEKEGKLLTVRRARSLGGAVVDFAYLEANQRGVDPVVDNLKRALLRAEKEQEADMKVAASAYEEDTKPIGAIDARRLKCRSDDCHAAIDKEIRQLRCRAARRWGANVRASTEGYERALRDFYREAYRWASAATSYFADPAHLQSAQLQLAVFQENATAVLLEHLARYPAGMSAGEEACGPGKAPPPTRAREARQVLCQKLGGAKATASAAEILHLGVSCEEVEVGVSTPGWIRLFGQGSYDFDSGSVTFFGGGEIEAQSLTGSLSSKAGPYVTFDRRGNISDFGFRLEGTQSAGAEAGVFGFGLEHSRGGNLGAASSFPGLLSP